MNESLERLVQKGLGRSVSVNSVEKLHGDASYRTYSRVRLSDGTSVIVMQMPAGRASASEEITNFSGRHEELPFINVAKFLRGAGLAVPEIYLHDEEKNVLILEDLGDELMAQKVEGAGDAERLAWYRKAIDLLVSLREKTDGRRNEGCVAFMRSFDSTLLNWEFDHFLEYGIEARLSLKMSEGDLKAFREETRRISAAIESLPRGFTHRDFQSRNLIVRGGGLFLIDFQDALLGPAAYDLVALTRDSYVELSKGVLEELLRYYSEKTRRDLGEVRGEFDLITIQRKLKDAGRFVYIDRVKGNPGFLKYIPASLGYVREALERRPELGKLREALLPYVPEWR